VILACGLPLPGLISFYDDLCIVLGCLNFVTFDMGIRSLLLDDLARSLSSACCPSDLLAFLWASVTVSSLNPG
jgi:hypothetical protein